MSEQETKALDIALSELRAYYSIRYDNFWDHYAEVIISHTRIIHCQGSKAN